MSLFELSYSRSCKQTGQDSLHVHLISDRIERGSCTAVEGIVVCTQAENLLSILKILVANTQSDRQIKKSQFYQLYGDFSF